MKSVLGFLLMLVFPLPGSIFAAPPLPGSEDLIRLFDPHGASQQPPSSTVTVARPVKDMPTVSTGQNAPALDADLDAAGINVVQAVRRNVGGQTQAVRELLMSQRTDALRGSMSPLLGREEDAVVVVEDVIHIPPPEPGRSAPDSTREYQGFTFVITGHSPAHPPLYSLAERTAIDRARAEAARAQLKGQSPAKAREWLQTRIRAIEDGARLRMPQYTVYCLTSDMSALKLRPNDKFKARVAVQRCVAVVTSYRKAAVDRGGVVNRLIKPLNEKVSDDEILVPNFQVVCTVLAPAVAAADEDNTTQKRPKAEANAARQLPATPAAPPPPF